MHKPSAHEEVVSWATMESGDQVYSASPLNSGKKPIGVLNSCFALEKSSALALTYISLGVKPKKKGEK